MIRKEPTAELDSQFSSDAATPIPWAEGRKRLEGAEVYWISTVRPDGRPHVTPLLSVWLDGTLYFCTGPDERKAKNLVRNLHCILTTGCNALDEGLDVAVEGDAVRVTDEARLGRVADACLSKYGSGWRFAVRDGAFYHDPGSPGDGHGCSLGVRGLPEEGLRLRQGRAVQSDPLAILDPRVPKGGAFMNWTLEVVVVPVSDVDRAKAFYAEKLGFAVDHDTRINDNYRVVQLTPPGSGCSIVVGKGVVEMQPGSLKGLQLVVRDVCAARAQLVEYGVEVGEVQVVGPSGPRPAREGDDLDNVGFVFFDDPDGNGWAVQQISARD